MLKLYFTQTINARCCIYVHSSTVKIFVNMIITFVLNMALMTASSVIGQTGYPVYSYLRYAMTVQTLGNQINNMIIANCT